MPQKPTYLTLETLDDRREIWHLLHRLHPTKRLRYLHRACAAVADKLGNGLRPIGMETMVEDGLRCDRGNDRLTNTIYMDLVNLAANVELDLLAVALDLERITRGDIKPLKEAKLKSVSNSPS